MDRVRNDLATTESIIIDVRFNGGGQDAVSFEILSRFIADTLQVATQKFRYENGYTPVVPIYIEGTKQAYTKTVYVLTAPQTGSAAESFSIATMAMANATRIGARTLSAKCNK